MNELLVLSSLLNIINTEDIEYNGETRIIKGNNNTYYK